MYELSCYYGEKLFRLSFLHEKVNVHTALVFAGNYFYNYAVVPSEKDFLE
ncbi:hypothetical protein EfmAA290_12660 [Enterococcus faecium]|nr:hypothetical protein EfmAA290_12660 [Enterococcus faecium]